MPLPTQQSPAAARAFWSGLDAAAYPIATLAMLAGLVRALTPSDYGILVLALAASGLSLAINPPDNEVADDLGNQRFPAPFEALGHACHAHRGGSQVRL
jgi:hypothetical protein